MSIDISTLLPETIRVVEAATEVKVASPDLALGIMVGHLLSHKDALPERDRIALGFVISVVQVEKARELNETQNVLARLVQARVQFTTEEGKAIRDQLVEAGYIQHLPEGSVH